MISIIWLVQIDQLSPNKLNVQLIIKLAVFKKQAYIYSIPLTPIPSSGALLLTWSNIRRLALIILALSK
jgi:hypothetical protein